MPSLATGSPRWALRCYLEYSCELASNRQVQHKVLTKPWQVHLSLVNTRIQWLRSGADVVVSEIMTRKIVTVEMDDSLKVAKEIFDNARFHHLLVIHRCKLIGVVSDRDLLKTISPYLGTVGEVNRDRSTLDKKVHQIMSRELVTLGENATINDAIETFSSNRISCIPIIDDSDVPVGIVSWRDILPVLHNVEFKMPSE